jgi:hypothetical protein
VLKLDAESHPKLFEIKPSHRPVDAERVRDLACFGSRELPLLRHDKTLALPRLYLAVGPVGVLGRRDFMMIATAPEDDRPLDVDSPLHRTTIIVARRADPDMSVCSSRNV